jgi:hypothetical protein
MVMRRRRWQRWWRLLPPRRAGLPCTPHTFSVREPLFLDLYVVGAPFPFRLLAVPFFLASTAVSRCRRFVSAAVDSRGADATVLNSRCAIDTQDRRPRVPLLDVFTSRDFDYQVSRLSLVNMSPGGDGWGTGVPFVSLSGYPSKKHSREPRHTRASNSAGAPVVGASVVFNVRTRAHQESLTRTSQPSQSTPTHPPAHTLPMIFKGNCRTLHSRFTSKT